MDYSIRTRSSRRRIKLSSQQEYLVKLRASLLSLKKNYGLQVILIDCPPTLGLLSMNSLCAADFLLVTLQSEYLAMEGLGQITGVVQDIKEKNKSEPRTRWSSYDYV